MADSPSNLVFGFDLNIDSIGFAAVDFGKNKVLHLSTHLFNAPEVPKTRESAAAQRRGYRSQRRRLDRAQVRKAHIRAILTDAGLVPAGADARWFEVRKGDLKVVELRAAALDRAVSGRDLARVLYHFACSRQYIDQALGADGDASVEGRAVLGALRANREELAASGCRTWGELLHRKYLETGRSTNAAGDYALCVPHELIRAEAQALVARQRELGGPDVPDAAMDRYLAELSWLVPRYGRDLKTYGAVGPCSYFPEERRAARACLTSEMEVAAERLAHVRVSGPRGTSALPASVREAAVGRLFDPDADEKSRRLTYRALRALVSEACGPESMAGAAFDGVDPKAEGRTAMCASKGFDAVQRALGAGTPEMRALAADRALYDAVAEALTFASAQSSYLERLDETGALEGADPALAEAARSIPCASPVFDGYGARSLKALGMLLDNLLEDGVDSLYDAEFACGLYATRVDESSDGRGSLLPPFSEFDPACSNPVVLHAAARFRKTFNEAVRVYGKPDVVRIELSRDLKLSRKERREAQAGINANKRKNDKAKALVAQTLGIHVDEVAGHQIVSARLWAEQDGIDLYTGAVMDISRVLTDPTYAEVDYILPWSRSFDDSRANKVLALAKGNRDKGARTPYEWMTSGEPTAPSWDEYSERVLEAGRKRGDQRLVPAKVKRLLNRTFKDRDESYITRDLNDKAYMSRRFASWVLASISFEDDGRQHVFAVSASAVSAVRRVWGLGAIGADDPSIQAAVNGAVAATCTPRIVQKCSKYGVTRRFLEPEARDELLLGTKPWETFDADVAGAAGRIVPTRSISQDLSGKATDDTMYSVAGRNEKGYLMIERAGAAVPSSTALALPAGGAKSLGGMAFIRLWLDPDARPKGKVRGEWLVEPVYYADIPKMKAGTYVPRYCKKGNGSRDLWPLVPERVLNGARPVTVRRGNAVRLGDEVGRFAGYDVSGGTASFEALAPVWDCPKGIAKYGKDDVIEVVDEDPLGLCWDALEKRIASERD